jgi:hypothetical protein
MFKQAKDLKEGDVVIDRGRRFTVKRIIVNPDTGMIAIINTDDSWHGEYHPEEYLGIVARAGIQLSTRRWDVSRVVDGRDLTRCKEGTTRNQKGEIYVTYIHAVMRLFLRLRGSLGIPRTA